MSIGRIENVDNKKEYVRYATMGGSGGGGIGAQVGNVKDLTMQRGSGSLTLCWKDPDDMVFNGQKIAEWAGTKVIRKEGGAPQSIEDGSLIADSIVKNQYETEGLQDSDVVDGTVYNYALFPYTNENVYTLSDVNRISGEVYKDTIYGFVIDQSKSDPSEMITYIETNANYTPAKMDFTAGKFDYGDWQDAFFMKFRPCFLNYDGTVEYYLDPDDYTKKEDGTTYTPGLKDNGNVMIEFPKVYWKIKPINEDVAEVYISDAKQDDEYVCWSHMDVDGNEISYCYFSAYESTSYDGKMRSLSNRANATSDKYGNCYNGAIANNLEGDKIWNVMSFSDYTLLMLLSLLISKNTNSQNVFGFGRSSGYVNQNSTGMLTSGSANKKGLFYGTENSNPVKIFGIENLYGNSRTLLSGIIYHTVEGIRVKPHDDGAYDLFDGTNIGGENYEPVPETKPTGERGRLIQKMKFSKYGFFAKHLSGTTYTTYYSDALTYTTGTMSKLLVVHASNTASNYIGGLFNLNYNGTDANDTLLMLSVFMVCRPMAK